MILFSGALLLTPGFFTDAVGFALLVPGVRSFLLKRIKERVELRTVSSGNPIGGRPIRSTVMSSKGNTRFRTPQPDGPSGWTRH
jgi:UPF0716 protein FxsA